MKHIRRDSPLHAARAAASCLWCAALVSAALSTQHPLVLAALLFVALAAGAAAGVGREVSLTVLRFGLPLAVMIAVINALVSRNGLTVLARLGEIPPLGQIDITLEATVYGAVLGLRALTILAVFAPYAAAVDPDEVLRLFRRAGFRSALTATLATRMVGVLGADARRLADGQRCRASGPASRLALLRGVSGGALDRATDVAAALEVRGYGAARRPPRSRRPWSRHDFAFGGSAVAIVGLGAGAALGGWASFEPYPELQIADGAGPALLAVALAVCALAPFADRRGIAR